MGGWEVIVMVASNTAGENFRDLALEHGHAAAEVVALDPVWDESLHMWQRRSRPGRAYVQDKNGKVVAVMSSQREGR